MRISLPCLVKKINTESVNPTEGMTEVQKAIYLLVVEIIGNLKVPDNVKVFVPMVINALPKVIKDVNNDSLMEGLESFIDKSQSLHVLLCEKYEEDLQNIEDQASQG